MTELGPVWNVHFPTHLPGWDPNHTTGSLLRRAPKELALRISEIAIAGSAGLNGQPARVFSGKGVWMRGGEEDLLVMAVVNPRQIEGIEAAPGNLLAFGCLPPPGPTKLIEAYWLPGETGAQLVHMTISNPDSFGYDIEKS